MEDDQKNKRLIMTAFSQPLTAKQLSKKTGIPENTCSYEISKYKKKGILKCLNPDARSSRLYWFTEKGIPCKNQVFNQYPIKNGEHKFFGIDWKLYGWVCFIHRSMIIKTLTGAMQPAEVKRILRMQKPDMRISANNIRDVIRLLLSKGIVKPVKVKNRAHLRYELTELGTKFRQLLIEAEKPVY